MFAVPARNAFIISDPEAGLLHCGIDFWAPVEDRRKALGGEDAKVVEDLVIHSRFGWPILLPLFGDPVLKFDDGPLQLRFTLHEPNLCPIGLSEVLRSRTMSILVGEALIRVLGPREFSIDGERWIPSRTKLGRSATIGSLMRRHPAADFDGGTPEFVPASEVTLISALNTLEFDLVFTQPGFLRGPSIANNWPEGFATHVRTVSDSALELDGRWYELAGAGRAKVFQLDGSLEALEVSFNGWAPLRAMASLRQHLAGGFLHVLVDGVYYKILITRVVPSGSGWAAGIDDDGTLRRQDATVNTGEPGAGPHWIVDRSGWGWASRNRSENTWAIAHIDETESFFDNLEPDDEYYNDLTAHWAHARGGRDGLPLQPLGQEVLDRHVRRLAQTVPPWFPDRYQPAPHVSDT